VAFAPSIAPRSDADASTWSIELHIATIIVATRIMDKLETEQADVKLMYL